jgi:hypothetical protein
MRNILKISQECYFGGVDYLAASVVPNLVIAETKNKNREKEKVPSCFIVRISTKKTACVSRRKCFPEETHTMYAIYTLL